MTEPIWSRILTFWFDEVDPAERFHATAELDARIRTEFEAHWNAAIANKFEDWLANSPSALALLILLDQFPRNMFRNSAKAFSSDPQARNVARCMIDRELDIAIPPERRHFVYLPFMHSEELADQDRCLSLIKERMPPGREDTLLHAKAHRWIISAFGRFPYRNRALGRTNTQEEDDWLAAGGYGAIVRELQTGDPPPVGTAGNEAG